MLAPIIHVSKWRLKGRLALGLLVWQGHQKSLLKAAIDCAFVCSWCCSIGTASGLMRGGMDRKKEEQSYIPAENK